MRGIPLKSGQGRIVVNFEHRSLILRGYRAYLMIFAMRLSVEHALLRSSQAYILSPRSLCEPGNQDDESVAYGIQDAASLYDCDGERLEGIV